MQSAERRRSELAKYGLTVESFEQMRTSQNNRCLICDGLFDGKRGPITVDHDHITGRVRGLLDRMCNQALGLFNDNAVLLNNALCYVNRG